MEEGEEGVGLGGGGGGGGGGGRFIQGGVGGRFGEDGSGRGRTAGSFAQTQIRAKRLRTARGGEIPWTPPHP